MKIIEQDLVEQGKCKEEADLIKEKHLPVMWASEIATQPDWMERAIASIKTPRVFLTIDLDGIDPTFRRRDTR